MYDVTELTDPEGKNLDKHVHVIQQFAYNYAVCILKYHKNIKLLVIIFPQQNGRFFYDNRKVLYLIPPACTSSVCHSFLQGLI